MSALPEPMRARLAAKNAMPPMEVLREFLMGDVADFSLDEVRDNLAEIARGSTRSHERALAAIEAVLTDPPPAGELLHLVSWYANRALRDKTDAGAAGFLREVADILRDVITEATPGR
ncbi:hypothetical protein [Catenuloplanes indicus]|uniref:Uncharacterized protein n=1 Tax=Catenuloplanes indicus TaxID=137267 RepID=A0AAE3VZH2_9ACTN|nr:hypothetical protein [Catenuloplanes indicus]MDQ0366560.1 hypothetical protein [Catenuloplanes indicus]